MNSKDLLKDTTGYWGYLSFEVRKTLADAVAATANAIAPSPELEKIALSIDASDSTKGQMVISDSLGVAINQLDVGIGGATFLGGVGLTGNVHFTNLPTHADDAAAGTAGIPSGMIYKTAAGALMVKL